MQEENKKDDLIDVGDADEKATEINLDEQQPKEEAAKEEEKVEVEQVEAKEEKPVEEKTEEKKDELKESIKEMVDQLPEPVGYRLLVLPFTPREKTKGGILFSQEQLDKARISTTCGYVLELGDLAYKDKDKYNEPWCKKGDWVIFILVSCRAHF